MTWIVRRLPAQFRKGAGVWLTVGVAGGLGIATSLAVFSAVHVREPLLQRYSIGDSWLVLALCLLMTALLVERLLVTLRRAERIERIVAKRTRELSEANRKLGELGHLKDEFVAQVSHELRTPMAIVREGAAQMLEGLCGPCTPEQSETLTIALRNIDRLEHLIADLLDLSKIESGKIPLNKTEFDLAALAKEISAGFEKQAAAQGLELKMRLPARGLQVTADREKIARVLTNLIGNALKFTQKGTIEISAEEKEGAALCGVSDTGLGIPPEQISRLFHKFEQLSPAVSGIRKGTGLGLAICKGILEEHGGKIWVENNPGQGAQFIFLLPNHYKGALHAA